MRTCVPRLPSFSRRPPSNHRFDDDIAKAPVLTHRGLSLVLGVQGEPTAYEVAWPSFFSSMMPRLSSAPRITMIAETWKKISATMICERPA